MSWFFEGSCFVVKDLRATFNKIVSSGFPYDWRGKKGGVKPWNQGPKTIEYVVYHQTYGGITPGEEGPLRTGHFLTTNPWFKCKKCGHVFEGSPKYPSTRCPKDASESQNLGRGRGFPKSSYNVFVPFKPQINESNKPIVYYCVDFNEYTWHSGKANTNGIAVGFQGMFSHPSLKYFRPLKGTDGEPSAAQKQICMPLWHEWLYPLLQATAPKLMGHWEWGKTACPGGWIQSQIQMSRGEAPLKGYENDQGLQQVWASSELFDTYEERQAALVLLGYDLGPYGPHQNGVDGDWGRASRTALEAFEAEKGLPENGYWDEDVEKAMIEVFKNNDLGADHLKAVMKGETPLLEQPMVSATTAPEIETISEVDAAEEVTAEVTASVEVTVPQIDDPEDPPETPPKRRKPRRRGASKIKAKKKE
jgi:hypothetical protein